MCLKILFTNSDKCTGKQIIFKKHIKYWDIIQKKRKKASSDCETHTSKEVLQSENNNDLFQKVVFPNMLKAKKKIYHSMQ